LPRRKGKQNEPRQNHSRHFARTKGGTRTRTHGLFPSEIVIHSPFNHHTLLLFFKMKTEQNIIERLQDAADLIAELLPVLEAAISRVQLANEEGNPILSAWLPDALSTLRKAKGEA